MLEFETLDSVSTAGTETIYLSVALSARLRSAESELHDLMAQAGFKYQHGPGLRGILGIGSAIVGAMTLNPLLFGAGVANATSGIAADNSQDKLEAGFVSLIFERRPDLAATLQPFWELTKRLAWDSQSGGYDCKYGEPRIYYEWRRADPQF